jgi:hypothetical protein
MGAPRDSEERLRRPPAGLASGGVLAFLVLQGWEGLAAAGAFLAAVRARQQQQRLKPRIRVSSFKQAPARKIASARRWRG